MGKLICICVALFFGISSQANILGSDLQSFNPASDNGDFVTVQSTKILAPGSLIIGAFVDEAINGMAPALNSQNNKYSVSGKVLSSDLHLAIGLLPGLEFGLNVVNTLSAAANNANLNGLYSQTGLTDVRLNVKALVIGDAKDGLAANLSMELPQVQNDYFYGQSASNSFAVELIGVKTFDKWLLGANLGFNDRLVGASFPGGPYQAVGPEYLGSVAANYHFENSNWSGVGELYAARPVAATTNYSVSDLQGAEVLIGAKYAAAPEWEWQTGMTTEIFRGTSSPDFRFYIGLNWMPQKSSPAPVVQEVKNQVVEPPQEDPVEQPPVSDFIISNINFATGSAAVPSSFLPYLSKVADYLKTRKGGFRSMKITGHTDSVGRITYNQKLSLARAKSVKKILVENFGVDKNKIETFGMGPKFPKASNETDAGRRLNRRIEIQILD